MLHYLENLFHALDLGSVGSAAARMAAVLLCLTVHETCHGLAAYALGDPTAKSRHRLSLNPLRHIDWFGLLMRFAAGKAGAGGPQVFQGPQAGNGVDSTGGTGL